MRTQHSWQEERAGCPVLVAFVLAVVVGLLVSAVAVLAFALPGGGSSRSAASPPGGRLALSLAGDRAAESKLPANAAGGQPRLAASKTPNAAGGQPGDDDLPRSRPSTLGAAARPSTPQGKGPSLPRVPAGWTVHAVYLDSGGLTRYYLVARPQHPAAGLLPVLVVLHGRWQTPSRIASISDFFPLVGQAVLVFPAGYGESWNAGLCCGVAHHVRINDVSFLEQVVRSVLSSQAGTSAHDVYLAGFSNGGRMALQMACSDPRAFAGVAAVEAVPVTSCQQEVPLPVLMVAFTRDPLLTIPIGSPPKHIAGHVEVTVQGLVDQWRMVDSCGGMRSTVGYGPGLDISSWTNCAGGRVALAVYKGGGHKWAPGSTSMPSAGQLIWSFFHRGTLSHVGPARHAQADTT